MSPGVDRCVFSFMCFIFFYKWHKSWNIWIKVFLLSYLDIFFLFLFIPVSFFGE